MSEFINTVWGEGDQLSALQMSVRAFIIFLITLFLIRLGGLRLFSKKSAFDNVITIMLGAVLSRSVVGASPFIPTVMASAVMIGVHRLIAWVTIKSETLNDLLNGRTVLIDFAVTYADEVAKHPAIRADDKFRARRTQFRNLPAEIFE